jgi:hypothetical protein
MLPRGGAEQAVQALAIGGLARRRSRTKSWAAAASAADAAGRPAPVPDEAQPPSRTATPESDRGEPSGAGREQGGAERPASTGEAAHGGNGASAETEGAPPAKSARRGRKAKQQGLPEGWVIDEEGFVVPGGG